MVLSPDAPVLSIAHRGGALYAPKNTMAAFTNSLAVTDLMETDAQITSDGKFGNGGWSGGGSYQTSSDGQQWSRLNNLGTLQFAVNATVIPEPSALALFGLSGSLLATGLIRRRRSTP